MNLAGLIRWTIPLSVVGCLVGLASAQTGHATWTIEARVGRAQTVFSGTIVDVADHHEIEDDGTSWILFTVKVDETIKGTVGKTVRLAEMAMGRDNEPYGGIYRAHAPFLWFISYPGEKPLNQRRIIADSRKQKASPNLAISWDTVRLGTKTKEEEVFFDNTLDYPLCNSEIVVLKTGDEILNAAKKFAKLYPGKIEPYKLPEPGSPGRFQASGTWTSLFYPSCKVLEDLARNMVKHPETGFPGWTDAPFSRMFSRQTNVRSEGIRALGLFKTQSNIALIKTFLNDPTILKDNDIRFYSVRQAAYEVLTNWGIDVPKPELIYKEY